MSLREVCLSGRKMLVEACFVRKSTVQVWPDTLHSGEVRGMMLVEPDGAAKIFSIVTRGYATEDHLTAMNEICIPSFNFNFDAGHQVISNRIEDSAGRFK